MVETIGNVLMIVVLLGFGENMTSYLIIGIIVGITKPIVSWRYLMNDHDLKEIIMYKGWTIGFQSIFQTNSFRQSIMDEIQTIKDERRGRVATDGQNQKKPSAGPSSSNKATKTDDEKNSAQCSKKVPSGLENEYPSFKKFYRQSCINTVLGIDETDSIEFNSCLDNLIKLERACQDNQYHFENSLFVAFLTNLTFIKRVEVYRMIKAIR